MKLCFYLFFLASTISISQASVILYQNTFDDASSLNNFTINGTVQVAGGELISPQVNGGGVALDLSTIADYSTTLSSNTQTISFGFNVAVEDTSPFNGGFGAFLSSEPLDPIGLGRVGYGISGGTMVGDRTTFSFFNSTMALQNVLIDEPNGIPDLPSHGTVRLDYDPITDTWSLYLRSAPDFFDPLSLTSADLVGTAINSNFTDTPLPYFLLEREVTDTIHFDNLVISIVPEPSSTLLLSVAFLTLTAYRRRR